MTTPLGRDVPMGAWAEYRKDQVLHLLYEFQRSPFNDGSLALDLASICHGTRLDPDAARDVVSSLVAAGLADEAAPGAFRITAHGTDFVHSVRSNPLTGSL